MDGRDEAKLQLGRGVVLAIGTVLAFAVMIWLGALSNVFSTTVMTTLAVVAFQVSIADTIAGVYGLMWNREPPLPRARVV